MAYLHNRMWLPYSKRTDRKRAHLSWCTAVCFTWHRNIWVGVDFRLRKKCFSIFSGHSNFPKQCTVLHFQVTRWSRVLLLSQSAKQLYLLVLPSLILIFVEHFRDQSSATKGSWAQQSVTLQRVQDKSLNNALFWSLSSLLLWAYMRMCTSTSCFFLDHVWIRCKRTLNQWHWATEDRWRTERVFSWKC